MRKTSIIVHFSIILIIIVLFWYIRIKTAKIEIQFVDDLTVEFYEVIKVSDLITQINGKILDDYNINTEILGKQDITFRFRNDDGIKLKYTFSIEVVDTVAPYIGVSGTYSIKVGSKASLLDSIMCADNVDEVPQCIIDGNYDLNTVGKYSLIFKATDTSGNESYRKFILNVYEPKKSMSPSKPQYTDIQDVLNLYKKNYTKIGIDVSKWQGNIDFEKIKNAGVEFVMIKIGSSSGNNRSMIMDPKFLENIENAKKVGLPVGIYFYSYANSIIQAKKEANWVIEQLRGYDISLPIVFDWEEWDNFNSYKFSFYELTKTAEAFLKIIEENGYIGMLYSSKYYLENVWFPTKYKIWLAHYTKKTNYQGTYSMWQLCNNGKVDGIDGAVDINILYL